MAKKTRRARINPIVTAPILRKGGVHEKSQSAKRQEGKRQLRKLVDKAGADFGSADYASAGLL
ncbi:MAG: hypothetical protein CR991_07055 [Proteobacteria bacterium]|nr:MAG: hypothetical protein CR991_07055 [Pseudomonadota bacterium]